MAFTNAVIWCRYLDRARIAPMPEKKPDDDLSGSIPLTPEQLAQWILRGGGVRREKPKLEDDEKSDD